MADIIQLPVLNNVLANRMDDLKTLMDSREFTSFVIVAIDSEKNVITSFSAEDNHNLYSLIGALEVTKSELIDLIEK